MQEVFNFRARRAGARSAHARGVPGRCGAIDPVGGDPRAPTNEGRPLKSRRWGAIRAWWADLARPRAFTAEEEVASRGEYGRHLAVGAGEVAAHGFAALCRLGARVGRPQARPRRVWEGARGRGMKDGTVRAPAAQSRFSGRLYSYSGGSAIGCTFPPANCLVHIGTARDVHATAEVLNGLPGGNDSVVAGSRPNRRSSLQGVP